MNKLFCSVLIVVVYAISVEARYVDPDGLLSLDALLYHSTMTSDYGKRIHPTRGGEHFHKGPDFITNFSDKRVHSAAKGLISYAGPAKGYGNMVEIQHLNTPAGNFMTRYGHLDEFRPGIQSGTTVQEGQPIGVMGNTGTSTKPHLHVEILTWDSTTQKWGQIEPRIDGKYMNIGDYNSIVETPYFQNNLVGPRRADGTF